MGGLELMDKVKEMHPDIEVMIITGFGSVGDGWTP
jgi:ActR/RegA family two-component response regulator